MFCVLVLEDVLKKGGDPVQGSFCLAVLVQEPFLPVLRMLFSAGKGKDYLNLLAHGGTVPMRRKPSFSERIDKTLELHKGRAHTHVHTL